jgi:hypothetical protein
MWRDALMPFKRSQAQPFARIAARLIVMTRARPLMPVVKASTTGTNPTGSKMVRMAVSALKDERARNQSSAWYGIIV